MLANINQCALRDKCKFNLYIKIGDNKKKIPDIIE